jgi:hypothetical protein
VRLSHQRLQGRAPACSTASRRKPNLDQVSWMPGRERTTIDGVADGRHAAPHAEAWLEVEDIFGFGIDACIRAAVEDAAARMRSLGS